MKSEEEKTGYIQNLANGRRFTFLMQFPRNFKKMISLRLDYFHHVEDWTKNVDFLLMANF